MACTASKKFLLLRSVAARGFSAQPCAAAAASRGSDPQVSTLPNKLVVATAESSSPITRISIAFRAGARNETYESRGASHMIRICAGLSTKNATGFGITRRTQQIGGALTCTSDREVISYTIDVSRNNTAEALKILQDAVTGQLFKPWELSDNLPRVKVEIANLSDEVKAVELLHRAAYRTGLGNSLYCPSYNVGKLSSETLQHYFATNFTTNRCAVVGVNVDHKVLSDYAAGLGLESGAGTSNECKYRGGTDERLETGGSRTAVAVATNGGSFATEKEALAFAVLQMAGGCSPSTKRGALNGALTRVIQVAAPNVAAVTLNASYSDNGLFGFVASGPSKEIGQAIETGVKTLKTCSPAPEDISRGRANLKARCAFLLETDAGVVEALGQQSVKLGQVWSLKKCWEAIDAVSDADVLAVAKKLAKEKVTVAAVGNLDNVPYASDLN
jgi:ubiquinol-cytochrome c reductase core subunit 2